MNSLLSDEKRWSIVALSKHTSLSHQAIANKVKCHRNTVANIINLYNNNHTVTVRKHPGRKKKLTSAQQYAFTQALRRTPNATVSELKKILQQKQHIIVSSQLTQSNALVVVFIFIQQQKNYYLNSQKNTNSSDSSLQQPIKMKIGS
jgi:transposase